MSAETKVDVRGLLRELPELLVIASTDPSSDRLIGVALRIRETKSAVAELIEAATLVCDLSSEEWQQRDGTRMAAVGNDGRRFVFVGPDLINGLIAALARIGGAA